MSTFKDLKLSEPLLRALDKLGYENPTPIQEQAIPPLIEGKDVLGCAQTGTGKTAAFSLPVLQHLSKSQTHSGRRKIRALILTPTRELAAQIGDSLKEYGTFLKERHTVIFGGVKEGPQINTLKNGIDILVATPGRLLDLMGRGFIKLNNVEFFVLDEADRMLDMGFVHDVRRVIEELPDRRQNLLFSATMPSSIIKLAKTFLDQPVKVEVSPQSSTVDVIDQSVMFVERNDKPSLLIHIIKESEVERAIIFTRTKHGANRLVKRLDNANIKAMAIHGNKSQGARTRALAAFRSGELRILIATDIASRGIDVDDVSHVFNFDLPNIPESYVHRIGRTARAGRKGVAIAFCDETEGAYLRDIERLIKRQVPEVLDQPYHSEASVPGPNPKRPPPPNRSGRRRPNRDKGKRRAPSSAARGRGKPAASKSRGASRSRPKPKS